jgi:hypothetical protein
MHLHFLFFLTVRKNKKVLLISFQRNLLISVLTIKARVVDSNSMTFDPDSESGSGSRGNKMNKNVLL